MKNKSIYLHLTILVFVLIFVNKWCRSSTMTKLTGEPASNAAKEEHSTENITRLKPHQLLPPHQRTTTVSVSTSSDKSELQSEKSTTDGKTNEIKDDGCEDTTLQPFKEQVNRISEESDRITILTCLNEIAASIPDNTTSLNGSTFEFKSYSQQIGANVYGNESIKYADLGMQVNLSQTAIQDLVPYSFVKITLYKKIDTVHEFDLLAIVITESKNNQSSSSPKLTIQFTGIRQLDNRICVYWDESSHKWKTDGITTMRKTDFIECISYHLSVFSVIIDPNPTHQPTPSMLTAVSTTGSLLSMVCLLLVIFVYYRRPTNNETHGILIQSCIALFFVHLSYQVYQWLGEKNCNIINVAHYFVLSFLFWTASDGINMWRILFKDIFNVNGYKFYRWSKIICWGLPTALFVRFSPRNDGQSKICELYTTQSYDIILYFVPGALILFCNFFLFCWMLIEVTCRNYFGTLKSKNPRKLDFILAITQVLGIVWCVSVPLLWFDLTRLIGQYLFAILVSTQGIFILFVRRPKDGSLKNVLPSSLTSIKIFISESRLYRVKRAAKRSLSTNSSCMNRTSFSPSDIPLH